MNINLMQSVVSSLEAAYSIARVILEQEEKARNEEVKGSIGAVLERLVADIKSDSASKGDQPEAPSDMQQAAQQQTQAYRKAPINTIMEMLEDPRYKLRSLSSLAEKADVGEGEVIEALDDNDVDFVTRTKRETGETLIGLADRN